MQKWSQDGRMFDSFFFRTFMDLDFISVDKTQKKKKPNKQTNKKLGQYPAILTSPMVNNAYVSLFSLVFTDA